jgi:hypothetical protein
VAKSVAAELRAAEAVEAEWRDATTEAEMAEVHAGFGSYGRKA